MDTATPRPANDPGAPAAGPQAHIPATENPREVTGRSLALGVICAIVFGAGNMYCGLKIGMTVTAGISAAILAVAVIRRLARGSAAECTIVQAVTASTDAVLTGLIFSVPALLLMGLGHGPGHVLLYAAAGAGVGGLLGLLFAVPLRNYLTVEEHQELPFPEATACAKIIVAGDRSGSSARAAFVGLGIAAVLKILFQWLKLWKTDVFHEFPSLHKASFGLDATPVMMGIGYIIGLRITLIVFAGAVLGFVVGVPVIDLLAGTATGLKLGLPAAIHGQGAEDIAREYLRYVGAGAMTMGGIVSAITVIPAIAASIVPALRGLGHRGARGAAPRTERDLSIPAVLGAAAVLCVAVWAVPVFGLGPGAAVLVVLLAFIFSAVSAHMVGLIGSSNQPVSGMTVAALMVATLLLIALGYRGEPGRLAALSTGVLVCIATCTAGGLSQDLKTGVLVGNTPWRIQAVEIVSVICAALAGGGLLLLFARAWGFPSKELPAPQATMIMTMIEGVMGGKLPWPLLIAGGSLALLIEAWNWTAARGRGAWRVSSLGVALGLYLPVQTSATLVVGGFVAWLVRRRFADEAAYERANEQGILGASGLIAGDALMAVVYAVLTLVGVAGTIAVRDLDKHAIAWLDTPVALLVFAGLGYFLYRTARSERS
ncbi:MAG TPA: oligopeptide transporter, OPT family [Polyangia bacterium]|jgi:putative OPT family oligopeptide transporter